MRVILTIALTFCLSSITLEVLAQTYNPNYDPKLAAKLGADDYGMKSFIFVILKTGTNNAKDQEMKKTAFAGDFKNINRLIDEKTLIVAGPFGKNDNGFRGLFILDVPTIRDANELLQTDPAIKGEYLTAEIYKWYGPAALSEYLESSDKIWKINP